MYTFACVNVKPGMDPNSFMEVRPSMAVSSQPDQSETAVGREAARSPHLVSVTAAYDPEADVWYVANSNLPGLNADERSLQRLSAKLLGMARDLLDEEGAPEDQDITIELTAHMSMTLRWPSDD
jgi:hypothetical protein